MIARKNQLDQLQKYLDFSPVVAILGPRQSGKTTLAKQVAAEHYFDLENPRDLARLEHAQTALESLTGLVVIDEVKSARIFSLFSAFSLISKRIPTISFLAAPHGILFAKALKRWLDASSFSDSAALLSMR